MNAALTHFGLVLIAQAAPLSVGELLANPHERSQRGSSHSKTTTEGGSMSVRFWTIAVTRAAARSSTMPSVSAINCAEAYFHRWGRQTPNCIV
jgi:hypothetical protein